MAKKSALSKALAKRGKKSAKKSIKQAAPQSERYSIKKDKKEKAKPSGYRFKGLGNFKTPTKKDIAADDGKPKRKRKTYFENRKDKSDVKPSKGFAKGGRTKKDKPEKVDPVVKMYWSEKDRIQMGAWVKRFDGKINSKKKVKEFFELMHDIIDTRATKMFDIEKTFDEYVDDKGEKLFLAYQIEEFNNIRKQIEDYAKKHDISLYYLDIDVRKEMYPTKRKFEFGGTPDLLVNAHDPQHPTEVQDAVFEDGGPILPEDMTRADVMEHGGEAKTESPAETIVEPVIVVEEPKTEVQPEVEVKIETTQKATIPNIESASYAENLIDFMGTNLEGKKLMNGDYVVLSFLYYPIWFYCAKDQKWYGNSDKYNSVTAMHISQSRPTPNAEMLSCAQLLNQMNQGIERYEAGGSILVRQLYPLPYDNTVIAHQ